MLGMILPTMLIWQKATSPSVISPVSSFLDVNKTSLDVILLCICCLGARSAGVPGELRGYWEAKQLYGNKDVSWESLIEPSIHMCLNGIKVTWHHALKLKELKEMLLDSPGTR